MEYTGKKIAVGMMMMNAEGFDEMMVMQGIIEQRDGQNYFVAPNEEPFEMRESWLAKLKPVEPSLPEQFQGAEYCMVIGSTQQQ